MFTPVLASGKFVGELVFWIGTDANKTNFYAKLTEFIYNLKKSHKVGKRKYPS